MKQLQCFAGNLYIACRTSIWHSYFYLDSKYQRLLKELLNTGSKNFKTLKALYSPKQKTAKQMP